MDDELYGFQSISVVVDELLPLLHDRGYYIEDDEDDQDDQDDQDDEDDE
jgi:hypothetical protein